MTQPERILAALKAAGPEGLYPKYFIEDLHIYQYNSKIYNLRDMFGCECKWKSGCGAKEHIRARDMGNGTHKFYYVNTEEQLRSSMQKYAEEDKSRREKEDKNKPLTLF